MKTSTVTEEALEVILDLVSQGKAATEIARALNRSGIKRRGGKTFAPHHIRTVVEGSPSITHGSGPPTGGPLSKTHAKTHEPAPQEIELTQSGGGWKPGKIQVDERRLALPSAPPGVTTQTKRETQIDRIEKLLDTEVEAYKNADTWAKHDILKRILQMIVIYDRTLVSAERAEATHSRVAQAIFILNNPGGPIGDLPNLPDPGDDPLPSVFTQEARLYIEELGGTWETLLERIKGEE